MDGINDLPERFSKEGKDAVAENHPSQVHH